MILSESAVFCRALSADGADFSALMIPIQDER